MRGRRWGGDRELGGAAGGGCACAAACSHRTQGGFFVRPAKGFGAVARGCLDGIGSGLADAGGVVTPRLGQVTCNMRKSQTRANRASWS
jgi:hypothetical protein